MNPTPPGGPVAAAAPGTAPVPGAASAQGAAPAQNITATDEPWIISYLTLRKTIGVLGVTLVPILVIGSFLIDHLINGHPAAIQTSVSAYYYTSMQNVLEGIIFGIGMFLLCYQGYDRQDSIISKLAGLFGLCIALFPTSESHDKTDVISQVHYITAGIFFGLLAYTSVFLFTKSSQDPTDQKVKRNLVYRVCGIVMAVTIAAVPFDGLTPIWNKIGTYHPTLILEFLALTAFGVSWLTKGELWMKDDVPSA